MVFLAVSGVLRASVNVARSDLSAGHILSATAAAASTKVGVMKAYQNIIFAPGGKEATDAVRR